LEKVDGRVNENIIKEARSFVCSELEHDSSGHDWWHIYRVTNLAKYIAKNEGADLFVCELAALLHDIADEKLNENEEIGIAKVKQWLHRHNVNEEATTHVIEIISTMSFKGGNRPPMKSLEGMVVQDADRLDAIGAIGIARTFAFAGAFDELMYSPDVPPRDKLTKEEYRSGKSTAVNHFYEKLLKLKKLMNTESAQSIAEERHRFMEQFLQQFYNEWDFKQ
jgi:uncharacterized protein